MKSFYLKHRRSLQGFSLVEAAFSISLLSFGFLSLAPLLALGITTSHHARAHRAMAEVAQSLVEQARQGLLVAGTSYLSAAGQACARAGAIYTVQSTLNDFDGTEKIVLRIIPVGAPAEARTYAVVIPALP